ncbi:hypothetical protein GOP47_0021181 [Adiantum capillus-veneris]|uniref:VQ domain-containing protein n=1 Tax=Adiantum capillus-veneris TaxID=13818 RepID=A0A9D4Z9F2_ADICA|nr:hypothetical protein GOP47_0021181 [Adiantum capillus-veneris]
MTSQPYSTTFRKFYADKSNFKEIVHQFTGINPAVHELQSCCTSPQGPPLPHVPSCRCNYQAVHRMPRRDALLANAVSQSLRTLETISACLLLTAESPQQSRSSSQPLSTALQALLNLPQGLEMANTSQQLPLTIMSTSTVIPTEGLTESIGQVPISSLSTTMSTTELTPVPSANNDSFLVSLASLLLTHVASQSQLLQALDNSRSHDHVKHL